MKISHKIYVYNEVTLLSSHGNFDENIFYSRALKMIYFDKTIVLVTVTDISVFYYWVAIWFNWSIMEISIILLDQNNQFKRESQGSEN